MQLQEDDLQHLHVSERESQVGVHGKYVVQRKVCRELSWNRTHMYAYILDSSMSTFGTCSDHLLLLLLLLLAVYGLWKTGYEG